MDDEDFVRWYGPWAPLDVAGVGRLLHGFDAPWWVVGGYAIERFTGMTRRHEDIDIAVLRPDAGQLLRFLAPDFQAWANSSGSLTPMLGGRVDLPSDAVQIWVRRSAMSPWEVDFVIADERDGSWVWRHDPTVTMPLAELTWIDDAGVRFARPEVVLAHKAKWGQLKDDLDFDAAWPLLDDREGLASCEGDDDVSRPWVAVANDSSVRAVVMTGPGVIEVTTIDDPAPGPSEVVIEVAAVGLCGTDLHILAGEHGVLPVVPGHEVTGTVVAAGADTRDVRVGDRVAVDPSLPCHACRFCRRGRENLCLTLGALGVTTAGGAAEYMRADASKCIVVPDHVDLKGATLIEPLSCVLRGYDVLRSALGASVLIYGAGTMGLLLLEVAKRTGPRSVHVVDPNTERAARAAAFGCTAAGHSVATLDVAEKWDVVIDATGNAGAIQDGLGQVARGGTFLQFGVASPETRVAISPYEIYNHEVTITGSMAVLHSFERAVDLFAAGIVDWRAFVTGQRPLDEYADALASFGRGEGVKTQVLPAA